MTVIRIIILMVIGFQLSCNEHAPTEINTSESVPSSPPLILYTIINVHPHDTASFTEGLTFYNGQLFESTGAPLSENPTDNGSWIGPVNITTGKFIKKINQERVWFGEGITFLNNKLYQLTYQTHKGFVYDAGTFKKLAEFSINSEGWGFTTDNTSLIMSSGTDKLYFMDSSSLQIKSVLNVHDNNGPVFKINELEFIDGNIYANQYLTANILKIDPNSGKVTGRLDLSKDVAVLKSKYPKAGEMNGIAYDTVSKRLFITGKNWPFLYEIKIL